MADYRIPQAGAYHWVRRNGCEALELAQFDGCMWWVIGEATPARDVEEIGGRLGLRPIIVRLEPGQEKL